MTWACSGKAPGKPMFPAWINAFSTSITATIWQRQRSTPGRGSASAYRTRSTMSARPFATASWLGYGDQNVCHAVWRRGVAAGAHRPGVEPGPDRHNDGSAATRVALSGPRPNCIHWRRGVRGRHDRLRCDRAHARRAHLDLLSRQCSCCLQCPRAVRERRCSSQASRRSPDRPVVLNVHAGIQQIGYRAADPLFGLPDRRSDPDRGRRVRDMRRRSAGSFSGQWLSTISHAGQFELPGLPLRRPFRDPRHSVEPMNMSWRQQALAGGVAALLIGISAGSACARNPQ